MLKQLSVFVENKAGTVCEVAQTLHENDINICALCIADTAKFGILRMIVNDPDRAVAVLSGAGHPVSLTDVLAVFIDNKPGGMLPVLRLLDSNGIGVEYMYAFTASDNRAYAILRVEQIEKAKELFAANNIAGAEVKDIIQGK